jgi:hypothetical protein
MAERGFFGRLLDEMVVHPWAALAKVGGLDRLPDRRVSRKRYLGARQDDADPLRRSSRTQAIYKALGVYALEESRSELYANYREMDTDPMIAAVLDAFAEDATQVDPEHKRIVWAEAQNEEVRKLVTATMDRLRLEQWAFPICRALGRDGDVFMHIAVARGQGVVALRPYEPWTVARIDDDIGRLIGFGPANEMGDAQQTDRSAVPHYRVLHFRLPPRELTDKYGVAASFLWGSRLIWRQLQLMEDQVVIQRLLRRPDRLLALIDTTGLSHDEAWQTVKDWERRLYREWYLNTQQNVFSSIGTPLDIAKDVVLPRGENNQTQFTNFPATNTNDILRDLDLFLARLAAGVGFPLGFIGRGGDYQPGQSLSRQYHPFAKRAGRLQQSFLPEVARLLMIDLAFRGLDPLHPRNAFSLHMASVSPITEIERNEVIQLKTDRMERLLTLGQNAQLNMAEWIPLVLEKHGGFSPDLVKKLYQPKPERELPQGFRPPPAPTLDVNYSPSPGPAIDPSQVAQAAAPQPSYPDNPPLQAEDKQALLAQVGGLAPAIVESVAFGSLGIQPLEETMKQWRPDREKLVEAAEGKAVEEGRGAPREDLLMEGAETRVGELASDFVKQSMMESRRKATITRLTLVTALAGLPEEGAGA